MNCVQLSGVAVHAGPLVLVKEGYPFYGQVPPLMPVLGMPDVLMEKTAATLLNECVHAAGAQGKIVPVSGWRSRTQQQFIWDDTTQKEGELFARRFVARPGCSEHETGLAIDLALAAEHIDFIRPYFTYDGICGKFRALAAQYGFVMRYTKEKTTITGIACEPWHFRYVGTTHALLMEHNGLCLEEYAVFLRENGPQRCLLSGGREAVVFYLPAQKAYDVHLPQGCVQISGDNAGGFIVTLWQEAARRCGA